jgi:hypothetical protein
MRERCRRIAIGGMASVLATLQLAASRAPATSKPEVTLRLIGAGQWAVLRVLVHNPGPQPICLPYEYSSAYRLDIYRHGKLVPRINYFEGRPMSGCERIAPGRTLPIDYEIAQHYRGPLDHSRLCFSLRWRRPKGADWVSARELRRCIDT